MGRNKKYPPLTSYQRSFIMNNYHNTTVKEIEATISVPAHRIYRFMSRKNLSSFDKTKKKKIVNSVFFRWEDYGENALI